MSGESPPNRNRRHHPNTPGNNNQIENNQNQSVPHGGARARNINQPIGQLAGDLLDLDLPFYHVIKVAD